MPASKRPASSAKTIPWPGILGGVILLLVIAWFAMKPREQGGAPVITSASQNQDVLAEAQRLSLQHLKDLDNGIELTDADRNDLKRAAGLFDALAEYQPDNPAPFLGAGKIYLALGNTDAAEGRLRSSLKTVPLNAHPALADTAIEAHYLLSEALFRNARYPEALAEIGAAIALFPKSPIYLSQRASILIQLRKYEDAKKDLAQAIELDANYPRAKQLLKLIALTESDQLLDLAKSKMQQKDFRGAIDICTKGIALDPRRAAFFAIRAASHHNLGEDTGARKDLESLSQIDPDGPDTQRLRELIR